MEEEKLEIFYQCLKNAFVKVSASMLDEKFEECDATQEAVQEAVQETGRSSVSVIIGMIGKSRGRIILSLGSDTARTMGEIINGEKLADTMEMFLCLCEFGNIFAGHTVTAINNQFRGTEMRLTPPALFEGEDLEILTPDITSLIIHYTSNLGDVSIDVGFEGV